MLCEYSVTKCGRLLQIGATIAEIQNILGDRFLIVGTARRHCLPTGVWAKPNFRRDCTSNKIASLAHRVRRPVCYY